jgi:hypothetical protein
MARWRDRVNDALSTGSQQDRIEPSTLDLGRIERVTFFKRDEITTDIICCEVEIDGQVWFAHEEADGWDMLLRHLEKLPGFRSDWYAAVSQPPFASSTMVAYTKS